MLSEDSKWAFYATVAEDSRPYAVSLVSGAVSYVDLPVGGYNAYVDGQPVGRVRMAYLAVSSGTPTPTIGAWGDPTATTSAQADGTPAGAAGSGIVPSQANLIPVRVAYGFRLALCPNVTGTMYLTRVV